MNQQPTLFESDAYLKFKAYDAENPQIWEAFVKFTFEAINKGFTRWSAEAIFNICRWENSLRAKDDVFKINNNYKCFYARKFMIEYPEHEGFFAKRTSKSDELYLMKL